MSDSPGRTLHIALYPAALQQVPFARFASSQLGILVIMSRPRLKSSEVSRAQGKRAALISHSWVNPSPSKQSSSAAASGEPP